MNPKRDVAISCVVVVAVVALAACGGPSRISTQKVIDTFRTQTGKHLVRSSQDSSPFDDALDFDDADPNYEWGTFTVYVVKKSSINSSGDAIHDSVLDGAEKPDENGIRWEDSGGFWVAHKIYGKNVILEWIGGHRKGAGLGAPFDRVDTALSALNK